MRTWLTLASALLALVVLACGDESDPPPSPTITAGPAGEALVYAKRLRDIALPEGEQRSSVWRIAAYDLASGREIAGFEVGDPDNRPQQASLAGDRVLVNLGRRVVSYALDGSDPREVYAAASEQSGGIAWAAASPDGQTVAITEQYTWSCPTFAPGQTSGTCRGPRETTRMVAVDADDGRVLLTIPQSDARFDEFIGYATPIIWRHDSGGFTVQGYTQTEAPGGLATVMLDGSVDVYGGRVYGIHVSPNGRYVIGDDWQVCDLSLAVERHSLEILDLSSGRLLAEFSDRERNLAFEEWSPDGEELLVRTAALTTEIPSPQASGCPVEDPATLAWHVVSARDGTVRPVMGVLEARRQWYGDRLLEFRCGSEIVLYADCGNPADRAPQAEVLNRGRVITTAYHPDFWIIGYLDRSVAAPDP